MVSGLLIEQLKEVQFLELASLKFSQLPPHANEMEVILHKTMSMEGKRDSLFLPESVFLKKEKSKKPPTESP